MATLYIEEYADLARDDNGRPLQAPANLIAAQKVTVAGSSDQSAALNASTKFVILTSDTACQWAQGANPTADANSRFLPANVPRAFGVFKGEKIAVIAQQ